MFNLLKKTIQQRFKQWLDRRIPSQKSITLNQRRIFIFPSAQGRWFSAVLLVMLIAAINYQNNMMFAFVFMLSSVFVVVVLHTYANLSGLTITAGKAKPVFSGDNAELEVILQRHGSSPYFDINVSWPESEGRLVSLLDHQSESVLLHLPVSDRGLFTPPRLLIETFYPLGLLRCWSWLALDIQVLVYPRPLECKLPITLAATSESDGELIAAVGSDEFDGFKTYQAGDPLKHVFWKGYAKGQTLQTKQFAAYREQHCWLDINDFAGSTEQRLSHICYWVLKLEQTEDDYGLRLGDLLIEPGNGIGHQQNILKALALYGRGT
ncbi:DUF58 domain-containing protein [Oceanicoccus sp. KOV_DT_Chl]|uniref:DUF58 domain-containing protein n=1 Tax=Oceanicoccus sp. KOV_DT_Chl TaxID=1904639 RepID=UPI000C79BFF6|nr:DUF58 domain-containing protein [Oceanicoccus sp. KOV_DT_Chl]